MKERDSERESEIARERAATKHREWLREMGGSYSLPEMVEGGRSLSPFILNPRAPAAVGHPPADLVELVARLGGVRVLHPACKIERLKRRVCVLK